MLLSSPFVAARRPGLHIHLKDQEVSHRPVMHKMQPLFLKTFLISQLKNSCHGCQNHNCFQTCTVTKKWGKKTLHALWKFRAQRDVQGLINTSFAMQQLKQKVKFHSYPSYNYIIPSGIMAGEGLVLMLSIIYIRFLMKQR